MSDEDNEPKAPRVRITRSRMVIEAMERIETLRNHVKAVEGAMYHMSHLRLTNVDCGNLRSKLIERELDEWRNLFMWGITVNANERARIKAAAHQRFLSDHHAVAHWFNDGIAPSMWLQADEEEFRRMAKEAFAPDTDDKSAAEDRE